MAISIDTVYQRVLAITNKEQRGYITPLEFNLIANQAQMLIFEQYFYDLDKVKKAANDDSSFSDMVELIKNKLAGFSSITTIPGGTTFPTNYRTGKIFYGGYEVKQVETNDIANTFGSTFHALGLQKNPVYTESSVTSEDILVFDSAGQVTAGVSVEIILQPSKAEWGYDVIAERALYNASSSVDFELHNSEETELVYKILELAGAIVGKAGLMQIGDQEDIKKIQQEKQ
tara:strand:+ start:256 stop:945 length:690 start_codon:yes stop_codon:yes gene_type:complete